MSLAMESNGSSNLLGHCDEAKHKNGVLVFDSSSLQKQSELPNEFVWSDLVDAQQDLNEPLIDLGGFMRGDAEATERAVEQIRKACRSHGFFQVMNHGVDGKLIEAAYEEIDSVFKLSLEKKHSFRRKAAEVAGYSGAHSDRIKSQLPWKETFTFMYEFEGDDSETSVSDYFNSVLGEDFNQTGFVYQKYCEAMKDLSMVIFELLGISLGIDRLYFRNYFQDGNAIMRCNNYPLCNNACLTLGTGPHTDPISLAILHQDQVGGLQVFTENKWQAIRPRPDVFVINIGDTFMALTNGIYKSGKHRAVVNREKERRSLVFFVCPKKDKVVRPPQDLVDREGPRRFPDFLWSDLLAFTQCEYRPDFHTLHSFVNYFLSSKFP